MRHEWCILNAARNETKWKSPLWRLKSKRPLLALSKCLAAPPKRCWCWPGFPSLSLSLSLSLSFFLRLSLSYPCFSTWYNNAMLGYEIDANVRALRTYPRERWICLWQGRRRFEGGETNDEKHLFRKPCKKTSETGHLVQSVFQFTGYC